MGEHVRGLHRPVSSADLRACSPVLPYRGTSANLHPGFSSPSKRPRYLLAGTLTFFALCLIGLVTSNSAWAGELGYSTSTSDVSIVHTSAATADAIAGTGSINADGATVQTVTVFAPEIQCATGCPHTTTAELYMDGSAYSAMGNVLAPTGGVGSAFMAQIRLIPSSGSHTFGFRVYNGTGLGLVKCGTGSLYPPCFIRVQDEAGVTTSASCDNANPCVVKIDSSGKAVDATVQNWPSGFNVVCTSGCSSAGTFALNSNENDKLNLMWWGTWAIVGLLLCALVVPRLFRRFRMDGSEF